MSINVDSAIRSKALIAAVLLGLTVPSWAAEEPDPAPPTNRPNPEALRNRFRKLTPEEREARLREMRARLGAGTNRNEIERRREEWRKLPPEEREARIREFRERNLAGGSPLFNRLTPAERETKRKEIKARVDAQIKELEGRRATAPLSPLEQRRLERFQQMSRRLEQGTALDRKDGLGDRRVRRPGEPAREGDDLPAPRQPGAPAREP